MVVHADVLNICLCEQWVTTVMEQSVQTEKAQGLPADWFKRRYDQYKCYVFPKREG
jgi:hypothetical protein